MEPTDDDLAMAAEFLERTPNLTNGDVARLIWEVRTEQRDLDAAVCETYAEHTTFVRKAQAAKECARRILRGPANNSGSYLDQSYETDSSAKEGT